VCWSFQASPNKFSVSSLGFGEVLKKCGLPFQHERKSFPATPSRAHTNASSKKTLCALTVAITANENLQFWVVIPAARMMIFEPFL
jgi:hypothetical protein